MNFENAKRFCEVRGGSLVDETSPSLQGFLSWEIYRRHKNDPNGQVSCVLKILFIFGFCRQEECLNLLTFSKSLVLFFLVIVIQVCQEFQFLLSKTKSCCQLSCLPVSVSAIGTHVESNMFFLYSLVCYFGFCT